MSTVEQPLSKRKRAEDTLDEATTDVIPIQSDIWFHDGNVILKAERTRFKVHQSVLALNSTVFRDMFSLPQPPAAQTEVVQGCPVVHLSDRATEVECVLRAIYQREYVSPGFLCLS